MNIVLSHVVNSAIAHPRLIGTKLFVSNKSEVCYGYDNIHRLMEVSVKMGPKTSKSQVGADFCCGWGNCHMVFHLFVII